MSEDLRQTIIDSYIDAVLGDNASPKSVYAFCRGRDFSEKQFFEHFASFDALETVLWESWYREAEGALEKDGDAHGYTAKEKYLALLFTQIEVLKDHRSWVLFRFPGTGRALGCAKFRKLKDAFSSFANGLEVTLPAEEITGRIAPDDWKARLFYPHLLSVIDFFKQDESERFERTDAYIEKSVRTVFDLLDGGVFDSGFDFLRFLAGNRKGGN